MTSALKCYFTLLIRCQNFRARVVGREVYFKEGVQDDRYFKCELTEDVIWYLEWLRGGNHRFSVGVEMIECKNDSDFDCDERTLRILFKFDAARAWIWGIDSLWMEVVFMSDEDRKRGMAEIDQVLKIGKQ